VSRSQAAPPGGIRDLQMKRKQNQFRAGANDGAQPLWLRVLALACLLLVGFASSAQAVHVHGQFLPQVEKRVTQSTGISQLPVSDAGCLLCVAMHSALPAAPALPWAPAMVGDVRVPATAIDRVSETLWHYSMFSRPPPAAEIL
jgi:hypothetical protein